MPWFDNFAVKYSMNIKDQEHRTFCIFDRGTTTIPSFWGHKEFWAKVTLMMEYSPTLFGVAQRGDVAFRKVVANGSDSAKNN
jgi:hypothetical protein